MMHLFDSGGYHWSLFMGHLVLEKLMKAAFIINTSEDEHTVVPPRIHDLVRLGQYAGLVFNEQTRKKLDLGKRKILVVQFRLFALEALCKVTPQLNSYLIPLTLINTFNISTRYPDFKRKIYEICTEPYTSEHIKIIEELRIWLLQTIEKP